MMRPSMTAVGVPVAGSKTQMSAWCVGRSRFCGKRLTSLVVRAFADGRNAGIAASRASRSGTSAAIRAGTEARPAETSAIAVATASTSASRSSSASTSAADRNRMRDLRRAIARDVDGAWQSVGYDRIMTSEERAIKVVPATLDRWDDVTRVLDGEGEVGCWCQPWRGDLARGESRPDALKRQLAEASPPPGFLAYLDGEPVGWAGVTTRSIAPRLRNSRTIPTIDDRD